jgi:hypothetical protein
MYELVDSGSFYVRSQGQPKTRTLCRRQNDLTVSIPYQPRAGALHLPIDNTGIKAMGEGEWTEALPARTDRPPRCTSCQAGFEAEDSHNRLHSV